MDTALAVWVTATDALAVAVPALAEIVAVPTDTAVTEPAPTTMATAGLLLLQLTDAADMPCPFWSFTVADS
jgi:hypothetical protein